jgi:hypothetical protein
LAATKLESSVVLIIEVHWIDSDSMLRGNGSVYKSVNSTLYMNAIQVREKIVFKGESAWES